MVTLDSLGHIINVRDSDINTGHSACNGCGKDMWGCWDVVCGECHGTFCYDCVDYKELKFWYCKSCAKKKKAFKWSLIRFLRNLMIGFKVWMSWCLRRGKKSL